MSALYVVRPSTLADLEAVHALATVTKVGLTTLPPDERLLKERLQATRNALQSEISRPGGESYLFVMEDLSTGLVVGTTGIIAKVGGYDPFYSYELQTTLRESEALGVRKEIRSLHLRANHSGPTEIGTLFLHPDHRRHGVGRLLSLSRFLFMADHPERVDEEVIAEMRGVNFGRGKGSPFWEAVGRHFFDIDFGHADALSAADKGFIADLMPKHPIYIPMLPAEVQNVIGEVHQETRPARRLLEQEGFAFADQVDIFDAGPLLRARRGAIRAVAESRRGRVARLSPMSDEVEAAMLVSNGRLDVRVGMGPLVELETGEVEIARDLALALQVRLGDEVRYVEPRARAPRSDQPPPA